MFLKLSSSVFLLNDSSFLLLNYQYSHHLLNSSPFFTCSNLVMLSLRLSWSHKIHRHIQLGIRSIHIAGKNTKMMPFETMEIDHHCAVLCSVISHAQLFVTPWTVAHQAPLSTEILQARILEWVAIPSSRGSSQPRNPTGVSGFAGGFFSTELPGKP